MGIRNMLRKVFGRDREDSPATSVPSQSREETVETGEAVTASETADSATSAAPVTPVAPEAPEVPGAPEEEARRAADDLVAASFDNPQVPKARKAEPEPEPVVAEEPTPVAPTEPEAVTEPATETAPATDPAPEEPEAAGTTEDAPVTAPAPAPEEPEATAVEAPAAPAETAAETPAEPEATTEAPVAEPQAETPASAEEKAPEAEPQAEAPAEPAAAPAPEEQQAEQPTDNTDEPQAQAQEAAVPAEPETPAEPEAQPEATAPEVQAEPAPVEATTPETPAEPEAQPETPAEPEATTPEPEAPAPAPVPTPETPVITALEPEAPAATATHEAPVASAPEATGPALSLSKVKAVAPHLADAYKAAGTVLRKQGLDGARAAVYLVVDRSGSMRGYFKDGSVQRLAEQTVALAAHLDEDAAVTAVFFSTDIDGTAELTPATLSTTGIEEINAGLGRLGRTHYHRAVEEVLAHHEKTDPTRPALVVFQTDGAPDAKTAATQALAGAADRPLHWRFVAWGEPDNKAFDYLRKLGGTPRTAAYFPGATPAGTAHAAFYRGLLEGLEL
ncbi:VWA domain-containing protein [Streptomyces sp. NPDC056529]|uniref:VWA domain-containing protein n=1 Tax=Streptomyces sp. NPDC056529 TaxID=3345855 RepID=UPI00369FF3C8